MTANQSPVAVLGATGYVGGRLVPLLLEAGYPVRAIVRSARKIGCRPFASHPLFEVKEADVLDRDSLSKALAGVSTAFYLVHSMSPQVKGGFAQTDRIAAENMAAAAAKQGVRRIIYLGGLGTDAPDLSHHLKSRLEVGRLLQQGQAKLTWLKAAMILGSGSASFEILRYLVERLPIMVTPRWVRTKCQPIAISNVLHYLKGCLDNEATVGHEFDIGGPDILTYGELFRLYAQVAGLPPRLLIPVPLLTPRLSSYWINLVTPVPASLAKPLTEGLRNEVICRDHSIRDLIPQNLLSCEQTIRLALEKVRQNAVETCWSDAGLVRPPEWLDCGDSPYAGGDVLEFNVKLTLSGPPDKVWQGLKRIGGNNGWYFAMPLWRLRGFLDRLFGGVGLRRGRRDPVDIRPGDALDFWRVLAVDENKRLLLLAEMKVPGEAVLNFQLDPLGTNQTELSMCSRFFPRGLTGLAYWYSLLPIHNWLFSGLLKSVAAKTGCHILTKPTVFRRSGDMCRLSK